MSGSMDIYKVEIEIEGATASTNKNASTLMPLEGSLSPEPDTNARVNFNAEKKTEGDQCQELLSTENKEDVDPEEKGIRFFPPAYLQRYARVREVLSSKLKKFQEEDPSSGVSVLEIGCAEFGMHFHFKSIPSVQQIIYMDIDKDMLADNLRNVQPLVSDSLNQRETPLRVEVYAGCITQTDDRIKNSDPPLFSIVGVEILEHLNKDVEEKFVYTIFKKYRPPLVILTTPNSDFNVVLSLEKGKFRHWDHRFELTRAEFLDWCTMVCEICPEYAFTIEGIADGPAGSEIYGCLSQMAVFELNENYVSSTCSDSGINKSVFRNNAYRVDRKPINPLTVADNEELKSAHVISNEIKDGDKIEPTSTEPYTHLTRIDYPWRPRAPLRERVLNEVQYHINYFVYSSHRLDEHEENGGGSTIFVSLDEIKKAVEGRVRDASTLDSGQLESWLNEEGFLMVQENGQDGLILTVPTKEDDFEDYDLSSDYPSADDTNQYSKHAQVQVAESEEEPWD